MTRATSDIYLPLVNEGSPIAKGAAYIDDITCLFYVTPLFQLRVRALGSAKMYALMDNVTWVTVLEDADARGVRCARLYYCKIDGSMWVMTYYRFGSNKKDVSRLVLKVENSKTRQMCAIKHKFVYPPESLKLDKKVYILMTDNLETQVAHVAEDFEFTQGYSYRTCYRNWLDPQYLISTPSIGFHPDDPLRMQVAVQRLHKATSKREVGVYVVSYDDRDKR